MFKKGILLGLVALGLGLGWQLGMQRGLQQHAAKTTQEKHIDNQRLPENDWDDLQGKPQKLSQWQGKVLVINHWATWCPPCREEIPMFMDYQTLNNEKGVEIIGIAHDNVEDVQRYIDTMGVGYPQLLSGVKGQKWLASLGASGGLPHTLIFDRKGKLSSQKLGLMTQAELSAAVEPLL